MSNYTIEAGDSLGALAREWSVPLADILEANPQITDPGMIREGQVIQRPEDGSAAAEAEANAEDIPPDQTCNCQGPVFLHFDGSVIRLYEVNPKLWPALEAAAANYTTFLNWINGNKTSTEVTLRLSEDAMAGIPNHNSREYEHTSNRGPTPHGSWRLDFNHWRASDPDPNDGRVEYDSRGKFTHHNRDLADRDRVAVNNWNETADYGSGGWAITNIHLPTGLGGRSGFVFHEDANANGSAGCIVVGYRQIIPFYNIVYPTVTMGFETVYLLVENYEHGRQTPSWTRHGTSEDEF
ncbi:LysM peptidoglycan-binding domain-containing protein [Aestuariibius sp. 2305UL40-4]|uniref:LysM peptidoglycan-binding domain-containing protein n=1 Tax=Aestuariibius violaceus TaxID=3234132 RepID=UPI00345E5892